MMLKTRRENIERLKDWLDEAVMIDGVRVCCSTILRYLLRNAERVGVFKNRPDERQAVTTRGTTPVAGCMTL